VTALNLASTSSRLQHISHDITGIKLEPIVALASSRRVGVEVLSVLSPHRQSERFFRDRSAEQSLMLLEAQLAVLQSAPARYSLFVNLPITVFSGRENFQRLLALNAPPLNVEIVDPQAFFALPAPRQRDVIRRLRWLRRRGHQIWLDDVDEVMALPFLSRQLPLSGIKIDKLAFWRLRGTPALAKLVTLCSQIARHVLIEGIETDEDYACARQAGAGLGQGFYWPSWTWPEE